MVCTKEGRAEWVIVVRRSEMDDAAVRRVDRVLKQETGTLKSSSIGCDEICLAISPVHWP